MSQSHLHIGSTRWHALINPAPLRLDRVVSYGEPVDDAVPEDEYPRGVTIQVHDLRVLLTAAEALDLLDLLHRQEQTLRRMADEDVEAILALQHREAQEAKRDELRGAGE